MRVLILTRGQHTVVEDHVFAWASKFKWYAKKVRHAFYAARNIRLPDGRRLESLLHREIMKAGAGEEVDHRDGDGLNNLDDNVRICSGVENNQNCGIRRDNTSGYKGVSRSRRRWQAHLQANGHAQYLGLFDTATEAAHAYDRAAIELHGEFARLNFPK